MSDGIGGDVTLKDNSGVTAITNNVIGGDLKCDDNTQAISAVTNTVAGAKLGQCSGF